MKSSDYMDTRHLKRIKIVQQLFAIGYGDHPSKDKITAAVIKHQSKIDRLIEANATRYKIERIAKIDLAILRLAIYELIIENKHPFKVIINEAVELGKELGSNSAPSFINAVLGKIYEQQSADQ